MPTVKRLLFILALVTPAVGCGDNQLPDLMAAKEGGYVEMDCVRYGYDKYYVGIVDGKVGCVLRSASTANEGFVDASVPIEYLEEFNTVGEWLAEAYDGDHNPEVMAGVDVSRTESMQEFLDNLPEKYDPPPPAPKDPVQPDLYDAEYGAIWAFADDAIDDDEVVLGGVIQ